MSEVIPYLVSIDPGRDKCGLAVLDFSGEVILKAVAEISQFEHAVRELIENFNPTTIVIGSGTGSDDVKTVVDNLYPGTVTLVPEKDTTLEARELAWREEPPVGIRRILPKLFWPEPDDLDAWAAVVIGRRALQAIK